eukprot:CAMPEP_0194193956 /NCGR_PEP_ID=MMETSP0154-20130528/75319_1 /TAXON_ID=1049557 /ORGANISM="Thalassiothrix antarctica, Strain L6-D1" /LENGTH=484 /DNA_ID=CAMNT_0038918339 /DNA_START=45 /DNA_END=1497 /DNA_ORIENTATION=+
MTEKQENDTISLIADRLKFFFSTPNMRSDRFLQNELGREDDFGGSILVDKLLNFKSIQKHTSEKEKVIEAAKTLPDLLIVSEDGKISCKEPVKKSQLHDNIPLSLHLSNLPVENEKYAVGVFDIKPLFEKYGKVTLIRLKWMPDNTSKEKDTDNNNGQRKRRKMIPAASCVVEFEKKEEIDKAVIDLIQENGEEKKGLEMKGQKIKIIKLRDWMDDHRKKMREKRNFEEGRGNRQQKETNDKRGNEKLGNEEKKTKELESPPIEFKLDWKPGCVIELKGLDTKTCDRESIRAAAKLENNDSYADYSRGQSDGAIRFSEPSDEIKKLADKLNTGEIKITNSAVLSARVLEGEEEQSYWKKFIEIKTKHKQQQNDKFGNKEKKRKDFEHPAVEFKLDWKPGCVIELKGLDTKTCDRESIRAAAKLENNNSYADYSRGQSDGAIRFSEPSDEIKKLADKINAGEIKISNSAALTARVLEGEKEQSYW